ncbi:FimD/PapC N-terminal domain-containing protein [Escherichia coli]
MKTLTFPNLKLMANYPLGQYSLNALINNKRTPIHLDLQWVLIDNQTAVCLTPEQLTLLGFTDEIIEVAQQNLIDGCYPIEKEKQITTYLDKGKMQLSISAPQAWLKYKDANWTPPELWGSWYCSGHFLTTIYMPLIMHHIRAIIHKI